MESTALIDHLNDHCLKHIFSFLSIEERLGIEQVCKRWRAIGEEGWNDIKELHIVSDYSDSIMHSILKRCGRFLRKLKIDELIIEHPDSLSMVIKFCQLDQLQEIGIEMSYNEKRDVNFHLSHFREIFEKSGNLVVVKISGYLLVSEPDYLNLLNPHTLQKLELHHHCEKISINLDRFPNLKELFLHKVKIIEDEMIKTEGSLKDLEKAWFYSCDISENFIQRIWTFKKLQVLGLGSLSNDNIINNEHIRHIAGYCSKMKEISLHSLPNVTSNCFQYLGTMPSLENFNFSSYDWVNSHDVVYLTNVKTLSFEYCDEILDVGLIELIVNSSNLEKLTLLTINPRKSFLDDIGRIFQLGRRKKHFILILKYDGCSCDVEEISSCNMRSDGSSSCLEEITYHPLLDLRVDTELLKSDDDLSE